MVSCVNIRSDMTLIIVVKYLQVQHDSLCWRPREISRYCKFHFNVFHLHFAFSKIVLLMLISLKFTMDSSKKWKVLFPFNKYSRLSITSRPQQKSQIQLHMFLKCTKRSENENVINIYLHICYSLHVTLFIFFIFVFD